MGGEEGGGGGEAVSFTSFQQIPKTQLLFASTKSCPGRMRLLAILHGDEGRGGGLHSLARPCPADSRGRSPRARLQAHSRKARDAGE